MDKESTLRCRNQVSYHSVSEEEMMFWGHVFSVEVSDMKINSIDGDDRPYVVLEVELPERNKVVFYGKREGSQLSDQLTNMVNTHKYHKMAREKGTEKTIEQVNESNRLVALGVKP